MIFFKLVLLSISAASWAAIIDPAIPLITPAPILVGADLKQHQESMNLASLGAVLLTGVPKSILDLALTNVPAVSKLLWSEFLDNNTPSWFTALPTDVQSYLSGEFGPTTTSNNASPTTSGTFSTSGTSSVFSMQSTSSTSTLVSAAINTSNNNGDGLPLWAKILIGVLVPLLVLGLLGLFILCYCRHRRHRRCEVSHGCSQTPSPAHNSDKHRNGKNYATRKQCANSETNSVARDSAVSQPNHHTGSDSKAQTATVGGPRYENIAPSGVASNPPLSRRNSRNSSRHSLKNLHSVPEMPESLRYQQYYEAASIPPPPRFSRHSQNNDAAENPGGKTESIQNHNVTAKPSVRNTDNPLYHGQDIYAGGHSPYPASHYAVHGHRRIWSDQFSDASFLYQPNHAQNGEHGNRTRRHSSHSNGQLDHQRAEESNWPLPASGDIFKQKPATSETYTFPRKPLSGRIVG